MPRTKVFADLADFPLVGDFGGKFGGKFEKARFPRHLCITKSCALPAPCQFLLPQKKNYTFMNVAAVGSAAN